MQKWVCPMRCLKKVYEHPGHCDVCHMELVPLKASEKVLAGYTCPLRLSQKIFEKGGRCPFCHLELKPYYKTQGAVQAGLWPVLDGKTAVYFRAYEVKPVRVLRMVRSAGRLQGRRLLLKLSAEQRQGLRPGAIGMISVPQGNTRPVLGTLESLGPVAVVRVSSPLPGAIWATIELRVAPEPVLAVPLQALLEDEKGARIFVGHDEAFEPRTVTVQSRGESFAVVSPLQDGEMVAGSGAFWLDSQWHMEHP